jgi:hypothetical protein
LFGAATPLWEIPLGSSDLQLLAGLLYLGARRSFNGGRAKTISLHPHTSADGKESAMRGFRKRLCLS